MNLSDIFLPSQNFVPGWLLVLKNKFAFFEEKSIQHVKQSRILGNLDGVEKKFTLLTYDKHLWRVESH